MRTEQTIHHTLPTKGAIVSLEQASDLVYKITVLARQCGCIPIAAAILKPEAQEGLFRVEGYGHNELGWGRPFVHGETGAFRGAGVIDYRNTVLLSSLSPCEFCQGCAAHLGIHDVRYLDAVNFIPDQSSFGKFGIDHCEIRHQLCCDHFTKWLQEDASLGGRNLWHQDIGSYSPGPAVGIDFDRLKPALSQVIELMRYAAALGEYPCGAVVVDAASYNILAYGPGSILRSNDPSAVAEIFAGRQCGARTRWDRTIFVTSSPPSPVAVGMYRRWGVRNLVILDPEPISVQSNLDSISEEMKISFAPSNFADGASAIVNNWLRSSDSQIRKYLSELYGGVVPGS